MSEALLLPFNSGSTWFPAQPASPETSADTGAEFAALLASEFSASTLAEETESGPLVPPPRTLTPPHAPDSGSAPLAVKSSESYQSDLLNWATEKAGSLSHGPKPSPIFSGDAQAEIAGSQSSLRPLVNTELESVLPLGMAQPANEHPEERQRYSTGSVGDLSLDVVHAEAHTSNTEAQVAHAPRTVTTPSTQKAEDRETSITQPPMRVAESPRIANPSSLSQPVSARAQALPELGLKQTAWQGEERQLSVKPERPPDVQPRISEEIAPEQLEHGLSTEPTPVLLNLAQTDSPAIVSSLPSTDAATLSIDQSVEAVNETTVAATAITTAKPAPLATTTGAEHQADSANTTASGQAEIEAEVSLTHAARQILRDGAPHGTSSVSELSLSTAPTEVNTSDSVVQVADALPTAPLATPERRVAELPRRADASPLFERAEVAPRPVDGRHTEATQATVESAHSPNVQPHAHYAPEPAPPERVFDVEPAPPLPNSTRTAGLDDEPATDATIAPPGRAVEHAEPPRAQSFNQVPVAKSWPTIDQLTPAIDQPIKEANNATVKATKLTTAKPAPLSTESPRKAFEVQPSSGLDAKPDHLKAGYQTLHTPSKTEPVPPTTTIERAKQPEDLRASAPLQAEIEEAVSFEPLANASTLAQRNHQAWTVNIDNLRRAEKRREAVEQEAVAPVVAAPRPSKSAAGELLIADKASAQIADADHPAPLGLSHTPLPPGPFFSADAPVGQFAKLSPPHKPSAAIDPASQAPSESNLEIEAAAAVHAAKAAAVLQRPERPATPQPNRRDWEVEAEPPQLELPTVELFVPRRESADSQRAAADFSAEAQFEAPHWLSAATPIKQTSVDLSLQLPTPAPASFGLNEHALPTTGVAPQHAEAAFAAPVSTPLLREPAPPVQAGPDERKEVGAQQAAWRNAPTVAAVNAAGESQAYRSVSSLRQVEVSEALETTADLAPSQPQTGQSTVQLAPPAEFAGREVSEAASSVAERGLAAARAFAPSVGQDVSLSHTLSALPPESGEVVAKSSIVSKRALPEPSTNLLFAATQGQQTEDENSRLPLAAPLSKPAADAPEATPQLRAAEQFKPASTPTASSFAPPAQLAAPPNTTGEVVSRVNQSAQAAVNSESQAPMRSFDALSRARTLDLIRSATGDGVYTVTATVEGRGAQLSANLTFDSDGQLTAPDKLTVIADRTQLNNVPPLKLKLDLSANDAGRSLITNYATTAAATEQHGLASGGLSVLAAGLAGANTAFTPDSPAAQPVGATLELETNEEAGVEPAVHHSPLPAAAESDTKATGAARAAVRDYMAPDEQLTRNAPQPRWVDSLPQVSAAIRRALEESEPPLATTARPSAPDVDRGQMLPRATTADVAPPAELSPQFVPASAERFVTTLAPPTARNTPSPNATTHVMTRTAGAQAFDLAAQPQSNLLWPPDTLTTPNASGRRETEWPAAKPSQTSSLPVDIGLAELVASYARPDLDAPPAPRPARVGVGLLTLAAPVIVTSVIQAAPVITATPTAPVADVVEAAGVPVVGSGSGTEAIDNSSRRLEGGTPNVPDRNQAAVVAVNAEEVRRAASNRSTASPLTAARAGFTLPRAEAFVRVATAPPAVVEPQAESAEPTVLRERPVSEGDLTTKQQAAGRAIRQQVGGDDQHTVGRWPAQFERTGTAPVAANHNAPVQRAPVVEPPRAAPVEANGAANQAIFTALVAPGTQVAKAPASSTTGQVAEQLVEPLLVASESLTPGVPRSLRFRLRPTELGQVEVEIRRDTAGQLSAHFTVEHEQTQQVLRGELGQLREALEQAGLQIGRLEVTIFESQGLHWHAGGQSHQPNEAESQASARTLDPEQFTSEPINNSGAQAAPDRLLNLHA